LFASGLCHYFNTRGKSGKSALIVGLFCLIFMTAVKNDNAWVTWLIHKPKLVSSNFSGEEWEKAVERSRKLQEQIDIEKQKTENRK